MLCGDGGHHIQRGEYCRQFRLFLGILLEFVGEDDVGGEAVPLGVERNVVVCGVAFED